MRKSLCFIIVISCLNFAIVECLDIVEYDFNEDIELQARTFNLSFNGIFNNTLFGIGAALLVGIILFEIALYALDVYYNKTYGFGGSSGYGSSSHGYQRIDENYGLPFLHTNSNGYEDPFLETYRASSTSTWSFDKIVRMISLARETYETGTEILSDADCQKKAICEVYQDSKVLGELGRRARHGLDYLEVTNFITLPYDIEETVDEFKDAKLSAKESKSCQELYPLCEKSLTTTKTKYDRM